VVASSNHAVGFHVEDPGRCRTMWHRCPTASYGVSKAAVEAMCRFYSVKFSMDIVCLRIGSCFDTPENHRMLSTWLSPADFVRLASASLASEHGGFRFVWGVSANTRAGGPLWAATP